MRWIHWMVLCSAATAAGCAANRTPAATRPAFSTTRPAGDPALLTLDEIQPKPLLPSTIPATRPAAPPSLDALHLYARALDAQYSGNRAREISLLRQALEKDPDSFILHVALGKASVGSSSGNEQAIQCFERAAEIEPDSLEVRYELGRQYLARGNLARAILHLRLGLQTREYRIEPEAAAKIDLFLARALQQKGHDRAALDQYELLLLRFDGHFNFRYAPELYYFFIHREVVYVQVGELNDKLGRYEQALEAYRHAIEREPNSFSHNAHVVRTLVRMKRFDQARELAADLVSEHRASAESISLLREVFRGMGREGAMAAELRRIMSQRPGDRAILFALAETLGSGGQEAEAEKLLGDALRDSGYEPAVAYRLFDFYMGRKNTTQAARLLVECLARRPESLDDLHVLWLKLARPWGKNRLTLAMLQGLTVSPDAAAAKLYWVARMAESAGRSGLLRNSLEQAVAIEPPFVPAYRELLRFNLVRGDLSAAQRDQAAGRLIALAGARGAKELAAELKGLLLMSQSKPAEAAAAFAGAAASGKAPNLNYLHALALIQADERAKGESILWDIIREAPTFEPAYQGLYRLYTGNAATERPSMERMAQADRILRSWLAALPFSTTARMTHAEMLLRQGRRLDAGRILESLFEEEPENLVAIESLGAFLTADHREEEYLSRLEQERQRHPDNGFVVEAMIKRYVAKRRTAEALRALEAMRAAVAGDGEQMYRLADLYTQVEQRPVAEEILREVLRLDPENAPANNYLGYMWAEDGRNLDEAESMIRLALSGDGENTAYLDSLGWVLYKRGKFEESRRYLAEAIGPAEQADPVVLDHLGDVLYRLKQAQEAAKVWQQSLDRLAETTMDREELVKLKVQLRRKLEQHRKGQPVEVAPVIEAAERTTQANN